MDGEWCYSNACTDALGVCRLLYSYPTYYPYYDAQYCSGPLSCSNANIKYRFTLTFSA